MIGAHRGELRRGRLRRDEQRIFRAQAADLRGVESQFTQDLIGVLAEPRSAAGRSASSNGAGSPADARITATSSGRADKRVWAVAIRSVRSDLPNRSLKLLACASSAANCALRAAFVVVITGIVVTPQETPAATR